MVRVTNVWVGRTTPTSTRVITKVAPISSSVRLAVDVDPGLSSPTFFGPVSPNAQDMATIDATGLTPDTQYYFAVEVDSTLDSTFPGAFRTFPTVDEPASFTFIAGNCAGQSSTTWVGDVLVPDRISNHPVFDTIRTHPKDPLFFAHLGDLHYYDLGRSGFPAATLANYRRGYDDVLAQPRQHALYRNRSLVYVWDDHDYGPNDSDGTFSGKANAQQVYRERVPHYDLPGLDGQIFQSFKVGRVLFIMADVRSDRDPNASPDKASKSMLGTEQKAWMDNLLATTSAVAVCWLMPDQWHRADGHASSTGDTWSAFQFEAAEVVEIFADNGFLDRVWVISGDSHHAGIIRRGNPRTRGLPHWLGAPLDSNPSSSNPEVHNIAINPATRGTYGVFRIFDGGS